MFDVLIIDGPYLSHRSHDAPYTLTTSTGVDVTTIHSFLRSLKVLKNKFTPQTIYITWESHGTLSWRRHLYPSYKPSSPMENQYVTAVKELQVILYLLGYKQCYAPNNEADDVIATLCEKHSSDSVLIFTVDKDMMQLVDSRIKVYDGKIVFHVSDVKNKFGINPSQIPDFLAIKGDKSDNIKGIDGWGNKKTIKLLTKYKNVESIPMLEVFPGHDVKEMLMLNKKLTLLNKKCNIVNIVPKTKYTLEELLDKYELKKIKENLDEYKIKSKSIEEWF